MTSIGTGYDLSASQFSPDGRVFQIEYAGKAVENSGTAVAIRGKDGVVFAVEKIVTSKLYEKGANRRIFNIDTHIGMASAGLVTDARQLASIARDEVRNVVNSIWATFVSYDYLQASSYRQDYGSSVPLPQLIQRVSSYMHAYTLYSSVRPFGVTAMIGTWSKVNIVESQSRTFVDTFLRTRELSFTVWIPAASATAIGAAPPARPSLMPRPSLRRSRSRR